MNQFREIAEVRDKKMAVVESEHAAILAKETAINNTLEDVVVASTE
jgi:hypothetical protein